MYKVEVPLLTLRQRQQGNQSNKHGILWAGGVFYLPLVLMEVNSYKQQQRLTD